MKPDAKFFTSIVNPNQNSTTTEYGCPPPGIIKDGDNSIIDMSLGSLDAKPTHAPSEYQQAIFDEIQHGHGHIAVVARAGSGKTWTIVQATKHVPRGTSTFVCAFNKAIAKELQGRVSYRVQARTFHSLGGEFMRARWRLLKSKPFSQHATTDLVSSVVAAEQLARAKTSNPLVPKFLNDKAWIDLRLAVKKLVSQGKNGLAQDEGELVDIADTYNIHAMAFDLEEVAKLAWATMQESLRPRPQIDYDDSIWLPVVLTDMNIQIADLIFVDEAQDMNRCQIAFVKRLLNPGGRIVAVGDPQQAIYRFRGAEPHIFEDFIKDFDAKVMSLPVSYRCAQQIVREVNSYVPDLRAAPNAPEGTVGEVDLDELFQHVTGGDFVLSRTNAPLVQLQLALIRRNIPSTFQGQNGFGKVLGQLHNIIAAVSPDSIEIYQNLLQLHAKKRREEIEKENPPDEFDQLAALRDQVEVLAVIAAACPSIYKIPARIAKLFPKQSDQEARSAEAANQEKLNAKETVLLSTVHRAKGLQADRVWLIMRSFFVRDFSADYSWLKKDVVEESNILYVATTRAKTSLLYVR